MLTLSPIPGDTGLLRVLCVGAHPDDIELGCGATIRMLQCQHRALTIDYLVLSGTVERSQEARKAMEQLVAAEHRGRLIQGEFPDGRFPGVYSDIKAFFEKVKSDVHADLIFCHARDDRHQDHRLVNEMVWSTFRDHLILEYEIPKWDGDLRQLNVYVPVTEEHVNAKVDVLLERHASQSGRDWFSRETFVSLMRLRGIECRAPSGYAEAFCARKVRLL
jgi:LmbE family N-acetylglucosaminyl deacetylase